MRKNRTMRAAALLLALTLITSCFVGGTMAKYVASGEATASATVAKWSFKVNTKDIAKPEAFTISPFGVGDAKLLFPGCEGSFTITVENASQVPADYKISFEVSNAKNVPVTFTYDDKALTDITGSFAVGDTAKTYTINWAWNTTNSAADNTRDTGYGVADPATVSIKVTVDAEQKITTP